MTTIYYLIHKRYEKQGILPSHFNIHKQQLEKLEAKAPQAQQEVIAPKVQLKG